MLCACLIPSFCWYSLHHQRRDGQAELTWVAGHTPRWFTSQYYAMNCLLPSWKVETDILLTCKSAELFIKYRWIFVVDRCLFGRVASRPLVQRDLFRCYFLLLHSVFNFIHRVNFPFFRYWPLHSSLAQLMYRWEQQCMRVSFALIESTRGGTGAWSRLDIITRDGQIKN